MGTYLLELFRPFLEQVADGWRLEAVLRYFFYLSSLSTLFWLLSRLSGLIVAGLHDIIFEEFGELLAVLYNIVLATLFSAVLFLPALLGNVPEGLLWRKMCGFVFLYLALGAAYADAGTHEINPYGLPGYVAGLCVYLTFAIVPALLDQPELVAFYLLMDWVANGWIGWLLTLFMVVGIAWRLLVSGLRGLLVALEPALWAAGLLRHPPVRLRRR